MEDNVLALVLTGGPCAGKTTALAVVQQRLGDFGQQVVVLSEAATEFKLAGFTPEALGEDFQDQLFRFQLEREERFWAAARLMKGRVVLLLDRGTIDSEAYIGPESFSRLIGRHRQTKEGLFARYQGVIHLRSLAVDRSDLYSCGNNPARTENKELAQKRDEKTLNAWVGHPHLSVVDNGDDLPGKVNRVLQASCRFLGIPVPIEREKKYTLLPFDPTTLPVPYQVVRITQTYLVSVKSGMEERVRMRGLGDGRSFYYTQKGELRDGTRVERERQISELEYYELLRRADPTLAVVRKGRYCFVWRNQYFELDLFEDLPELCLLEVETTTEQEAVLLPGFLLRGATEVTNNPQFYNRLLARQIAQSHRRH